MLSGNFLFPDERESMKKNKISVKAIATVGVLGAVAAILMYLEFPLTFLIPSFVKFDFSDLPALLASFALGPIAGATVCLIKCVIHIAVSSSAGVGELANFILGCCFVIPAGMIYKRVKTKKSALIGSFSGSAVMAAASLPVNYFITYPFYMKAYSLTEETIVSMYRAILPSVKNLPQALLIFNVPFTLVKGLIVSAIVFFTYKRLSPILHGRK